MFEEYLKDKINEVKDMSEKELLDFMYENGNLPEVEYKKYIEELKEGKE